jgi:hypothetical protein
MDRTFMAILVEETKKAYRAEELREVMGLADDRLTGLGLGPIKEFRPRADRLEAAYPVTWTVYGTKYTVNFRLLVQEPKAQVAFFAVHEVTHPALRAVGKAFEEAGFYVRGSRFHEKESGEVGPLHMDVLVASSGNISAFLTVSVVDASAVTVEE